MAAVLPLTTAVVPVGGTSIACAFNTQGNPPLSGAIDGFTVKVNGAVRAYGYGVFTAAPEITLFLLEPIFAGDEVTVSIAASTAHNSVGDTLADIADFAATNNSTVEGLLGGGAAGYYADQNDLHDWYGVANIALFSQLNPTLDTADAARIQKWLTKADALINLRFSEVGRTVPIATTDRDFSALSNVAAEWTGAMLAKGRGDLPRGYSKRDEFDDAMDGHIQRATDELNRLIGAWEEDNPGTADPALDTITSVPLSYGDDCGACNEFGCE